LGKREEKDAEPWKINDYFLEGRDTNDDGKRKGLKS
jgi:hypothetical protein